MAKKYWYRAMFTAGGHTKEETGTYELDGGESPTTIIDDLIDSSPLSAGRLASVLVWEMTPDGDLSPYTVASMRGGKVSAEPPRDVKKPLVLPRQALPEGVGRTQCPVDDLTNNCHVKEPVVEITPRLSRLLEAATWATPVKINTCYLGEFATVTPKA